MSFDLRRRRRPVHTARGNAYACLELAEQLFAKKGVALLQHDMDVANGSGATVRGDMNNALEALATLSSGASEPGTTYAYQLWADTTTGTLKRRNAANTGWIQIATLDETPVEARSSNTIIAAADFGKTLICTSTFTQTLTAAATLGTNFHFWIRNAGTGVITIDPNSSETIDGRTTIAVYPGECFKVVCDASHWHTIGRSKVVVLQDQTASGAATIDTTIGYDDTEITRIEHELIDIVPQTDTADLWCRVGTGAGPTYASGASDYMWQFQRATSGAVASGVADDADSEIHLALNLGTGTGESLSGFASIRVPSGTAVYKPIKWSLGHLNATPAGITAEGSAHYAATTAITAMRFLCSTGNINGRLISRGYRA